MEDLNLYDIPKDVSKEILDGKFAGCELHECGIEELVDALKKGIVKFRYLKKDGETIRDAYGTMVEKKVGKPKVTGEGKNGRRSVDKDVYTTYYDICPVKDGKVSGIVTRIFINGNLKGMCPKVVSIDEVIEEYGRI